MRLGPRAATIGRALQLAWDASPALFICQIVAAVIQGILPALILVYTQRLIDSIIATMTTDVTASVRPLLVPIALVCFLQFSVSAFGAFAQYLSNIHGERTYYFVALTVMNTVTRIDIAHFEDSSFQDRLQLVRSESTYRPTQLIAIIFPLLRSVVNTAAIIWLLLHLSPWFVLITLATCLPGLLLEDQYSRRAFLNLRDRAKHVRQASYLSWLMTTDTPVKEVRAFSLGHTFLESYRRISTHLYLASTALARLRVGIDLLTIIITAVASLVNYVYATSLVVQGRITVGGFVQFHQSIQQASSSISSIAMGLSRMNDHIIFLSILFEFLSMKNETRIETEGRYELPKMTHGLGLEHVSFAYPGSPKPAIEDVTLNISPGSIVAIVGDNGSGKSTLVKLLLRFYEPTSGVIKWDGIDVKEYDIADYRSRITCIFQDHQRYQVSLYDNIRYGDVLAPDPEDRIIDAAQAASLDSVVTMLPFGYQTQLGKWFDGGQELSAGQWQRVAFARGLMKEAQVCIFDEPTAWLDINSEGFIMESLNRLAKSGRSVLLISHRLSSLRHADHILVLEDGRVQEQGTHDELVQHNGRYAKWFTAQAMAYQATEASERGINEA